MATGAVTMAGPARVQPTSAYPASIQPTVSFRSQHSRNPRTMATGADTTAGPARVQPASAHTASVQSAVLLSSQHSRSPVHRRGTGATGAHTTAGPAWAAAGVLAGASTVDSYESGIRSGRGSNLIPEHHHDDEDDDDHAHGSCERPVSFVYTTATICTTYDG